MAIRLVTTAASLRAQSRLLLTQKQGSSQGLVPTMGALHEGHARLARTAVEQNDVVVASIFVNPLQFGEAADLDRYPRTLEADMALLEAQGVDLVFAPSRGGNVPGRAADGPDHVRHARGKMGGSVASGAFRRRPHRGGQTAPLRDSRPPDCPGQGAFVTGAGGGLPAYRAYFGQKDAQQLALVRRMVADLNFPVEIVAVPTIRSADGLALSSRNRFLSAEEREAALVLSRALRLIEERANARKPLEVESARALIESQPLVELDYLEVVDPRTLEPLAENCRETPFRGEGLAIVAAKVGPCG